MRTSHLYLIGSIVVLGLAACGEEPATPTEPGAGGGAGRPDAMIRPDTGGAGGSAGSGGQAGAGGTAGTGGAAGAGGARPTVVLPYGTCPEQVDFSGQVQGTGSASPNGGTVLVGSYDGNYRAGLRAVLDRIPAPDEDDDPDPVNVNLRVNGARVVATRTRTTPRGSDLSSNQGQFWIADADGTVEVYVDLERDQAPNFDVRVGQSISFQATRVGRFGTKPQIVAGANWVLDEAQGVSGQVALREPQAPLSSGDVPNIVRVTGLISGQPTACGGTAQCWPMNYGPASALLRTTDTSLKANTCVTFVGPVSSFRTDVQFDVVNPDWAMTYQRGGDVGDDCSTDEDCSGGICIALGEERVCSLRCEDNGDCPFAYSCQHDVCLPGGAAECPAEITFTGQLLGEEGERPDGGHIRDEPYPENYDTGLEIIIARVPPQVPGRNQPPLRLPSPLPVHRVTIIATGAFNQEDVPDSQKRIWVADGRGAIEMYLDDSSPGFAVSVGQIVSFEVNEVKRYGARPQITEVQDWEFHEMADPMMPDLPAGPMGEIYIFEPGRELGREDINQIVRITGTLEGQPESCGGGNSCWLLNYGFGPSLLVRTSDEMAQTGSCVTFVGPLGSFGGDLQLDTVNPSWLSVYN